MSAVCPESCVVLFEKEQSNFQGSWNVFLHCPTAPLLQKTTRIVKHTSPNRGCFYQQWVLHTLAEGVLLSDEAEQSITFHPCYRAGRRLSVIPTDDLIAAMIRKGSLWKHCANSVPGVIPLGLCQELSWPRGWIIWFVTQPVIYF